MKSNTNMLRRAMPTVLAIVILGSVWGLLEMTLGGFLHTIHFVGKGAVMGGIAISLMTVFLAISKKPLLAPLLGVIAASFKPFSALIFGQALFSPFVVNPMIAIMAEALIFGVVVFALHKAMQKHLFAKVGVGFLAGGLGFVLYAALASMLNLGKWPFLIFSEKIDTVISNGLPIALAGALMMLVAHYAINFSLPRFASFKALYPKVYYSTAFSLVALSWIIPPVFRL